MNLNNEFTIRQALKEKIAGLEEQIKSLELKNRLLTQRLNKYEPPPDEQFTVKGRNILIPQG